MTYVPRALALVALAALAACGETQSPPIVAKEDTRPTPPAAPEIKLEAPKAEAPKAEAPKVEAPRAEAPKQDAPPAEAPPAELPTLADAKAEAPQAAPEQAPPPSPGGPGPAFFAIDKKGIVRLDQGEFVALKDAPKTLIKNLHVAGDGALWVLGFETIYKLPTLTADGFKEVVKGSFDETGSIDDFFVVKDDDIWAAGFSGVSHWDGKSWTREEKAAIGADDLIEGVVVGEGGKVWVASSGKIHVKEGGAWTTVDLGKVKSGRLFMEGIERAADGTIWALASAVLIKLGPAAADAEAVKLGGGSIPSYSDLAVGPDGTIAARNLFDLVVRAPDGKARVWKKKDYLSEGVRALAVDGAGRVWVGSEIGAAVLGPGDAKVEWPSGVVPALAGEIVGVAVVGTGPAALPTVGPVKTGGLKGKVLRDGQPLAKIDVELCPSPGMLYSKTPCADSSVKFAGKTDERGEWQFDGVPLGAYGIAIKVDGKWRITMGSDLGVEMKEGQVYDLGSIALKSEGGEKPASTVK